MSTDQGLVYCGYTVDGSRRHSFTESDDQVERDVIDLGYPYYVGTADTKTPIAHTSGKLQAGSASLQAAVPRLTGSQVEPWKGWWHLCVTDAKYYRRQRLGT